MSPLYLALVTSVALAVTSCVLVLALFFLRNVANRRVRTSAPRRAALRRMLMALATGETDDPATAQAGRDLLALRGRARRTATTEAFVLLAKTSGEARDRLARLVGDWGGVADAVRKARSRRATRRCTGLHRLGQLRHRPARPTLAAALADPHPLVRRVAMDACAQLGDAAPLEAMTDVAVSDVTLRRDYLAGIAVLGPRSGPRLGSMLADHLSGAAPSADETPGEGVTQYRLRLLCEAVGVIRDGSSGPLLASVVLDARADAPEDRDEDLAPRPVVLVAAVRALGRIGNPAYVEVLREVLRHPDPVVRRVAAVALGRIGAASAAPALGSLTDDTDLTVARAAATALASCGTRGSDLLELLDTPAAIETRAMPTWGRSVGQRAAVSPRTS